MLYVGVMVLNLIASCYLLLRRANAIAPDVTPPVRLRRWTAAFLCASVLSHLWYMPTFYLTSVEEIKMVFFTGALFDFLTVFPLAIAIMLVMLQDRRRPLWPIAVTMAPIVVGMTVCTATRSDTIPMVLYVYYLLLVVGLIIYMVRATRQYGRWLRDNYADLEHKELWQSLMVLAIILAGFVSYVFELYGPFYKYIAQANGVILVCFFVWRVETISDLSSTQTLSLDANEEPDAGETMTDDGEHPLSGFPPTAPDRIGLLLQRHCIDTQLYLQHDLTIHQLATAVGTNRYYLSQYFSRQGTTYNAYINGLRIDHFVGLYRQAVAAKQGGTVRKLAQDSGYRNYATFSNAFKQRMGKNVTAWIKEGDGEHQSSES